MPVKKLKERVLNYRIKGDSKDSVRHLHLKSWSDIKSVGIIYQVQEESDYIRFTEFTTALQNERKEVRTLGLIPSKEIPHFCYPKLYFDYFSRKDLNWYGKPGGSKIVDFINIDFDLLINLDFSGKQSFDYILGTSKAKLKAGIYRPEASSHYDLMISMGEKIDYEVFLNHVKDYIRMLRPAG